MVRSGYGKWMWVCEDEGDFMVKFKYGSLWFVYVDGDDVDEVKEGVHDWFYMEEEMVKFVREKGNEVVI